MDHCENTTFVGGEGVVGKMYCASALITNFLKICEYNYFLINGP